ncbi:Importin-11, partial [Ascosphaera pollenicola]
MLMDEIRVPLASSLNKLLSVTVKERLGIVPLLGERMIRAVDMVEAGNEQAVGVLATTLVETGFLRTILAGLHDAYQANQTSGPNRKTSLIFGVMETDYFSVLARLALASPGIFIESVTAACSGQTQEQAMKWLLTEWFSHWDNMGDVNRKKLHGLALTRL